LAMSRLPLPCPAPPPSVSFRHWFQFIREQAYVSQNCEQLVWPSSPLETTFPLITHSP
jgi:hypothetical protein